MKAIHCSTFLLLLTSITCIECDPSIFYFTSNYSLSQMNELRRTFEKMAPLIKQLPASTVNVSLLTYALTQIAPTFDYLDSKQNSQIVGNNTIVIVGGRVQVTVKFNWQKTGMVPQGGNGTASIISDELMFSKSILADKQGFLYYELMSYLTPTFNTNSFKLDAIYPPTIPDSDVVYLMQILNGASNIKGVRQNLQSKVVELFESNLRTSLHEDHEPIVPQYNYTWMRRNSSPFTIQFNRRPVAADVEKEGISKTFDEQIVNGTDWHCGKAVPNVPLLPKEYGGLQQFISLEFFANTIRYAASKQQLDTELIQSSWESKMFQFYAGDLYEVIPAIARTFTASSEVKGTCQTRGDEMQVKSDVTLGDLFRVAIMISTFKVAQFSLQLGLKVQGLPNNTHINFRVVDVATVPNFQPQGQFVVENEHLARDLVTSTANQLLNQWIFGSGWPLSPSYDFPHFTVQLGGWVAIYDSSHVGGHSKIVDGQSKIVDGSKSKDNQKQDGKQQ